MGVIAAAALLMAGLFAPCLAAAQQPPTAGALRAELSRLLAEGKIEEAVRHAQGALSAAPDDTGVRREFVDLHMSLARDWIARRGYTDARSALQAVLAIEPANAAAKAMLAELDAALKRLENQRPEVEKLIRLELFESALDRIRQVREHRPDVAANLADLQRDAWLGAADDHYLARNFNEAFALYEKLLSTSENAGAEIHLRWGLSLVLALDELDDADKPDARAARRMLSRAEEVLSNRDADFIRLAIIGLVAEAEGRLIEAAKILAGSLGEPWELPRADRRRAVVMNLRNRVVERLRDLYERTPPARRGGAWAVALPNVWKQAQTPHFEVHGRSELIASRVAEAAEYHFVEIARWLGAGVPADWSPRCEIRIYADLDEFHQATGTSGVTRAVSRTRVQGDRVLLRQISAFQSDPWLLSSTLPHELTHVLLAEAAQIQGEQAAKGRPSGRVADPVAPPFALDEGLAVQVEPPARRLQYRRLLVEHTPNPLNLLQINQLIGDQAAFYARCDALAEFVLRQAGMSGLIALCRDADGDWWTRLGWPGKESMLADWQRWYTVRRNPPRMPLMIQSPAAPTGAGTNGR